MNRTVIFFALALLLVAVFAEAQTTRTAGDAVEVVTPAAPSQPVNLFGVTTAVFSGASQYYIEDRNRCWGIQVRFATSPSIGQSVMAHGTIRIDSSTQERYLDSDSWVPSGSPVIIEPLSMSQRNLGGAARTGQPGVYNGVGLNNVGMLVKITGKVTGCAADRSYIYITDGSGVSDGIGTAGVRVNISYIPAAERNAIQVGDALACTGISSVYQLGGHYNRMVKVRSGSDIAKLPDLADASNTPIVKKVMVINFDPIIESRDNTRLCALYWPDHDPRTILTPGYNNDLFESTDGYVTYQVVEWVDADYFPIKNDGFQYTDATFTYAWEHGGPFHSPDGVDYIKVCTDKYYSYNNPKTVAERVAAGDIDEVYMFGAPYFGYYESAMVGPSPFYINGGTFYLPEAGRDFAVMGFNYERYIGEMLEDYGHRSESTMWRIYGYNWRSNPPVSNWDYFTLLDKDITDHDTYTSGCGNVHFAPNSTADYQWGNFTYVWSTCDDWLNNWPNLTGVKKYVNTLEWGSGDMRAHHKWWFKHFPNKPGINPDGRQNNWWKYVADFQNYYYW